MVSHLSKVKINHRCCQLLETLCIPQGFALENTNDPGSLKEILRRQYQSKGLTIVSDEALTFFKVLYCKLKSLQTFKNLEHNKINLLQVTVLQLQDVDLLDLWCNLFHQTKQDCTECESTCNVEVNDNTDLEYELEMSLILQLFEEVVHYFSRVHLSDILDKYKDTILQKKTQVSIQHQIISGIKKKDIDVKLIQYPCGSCGKECIDVESVKDPHFEDFSVGCDKCMKWYHYTCQGLNGSEPQIQEGSSLPYFCNVCKLSLPESEEQTNMKEGCSKGKREGKR